MINIDKPGGNDPGEVADNRISNASGNFVMTEKEKESNQLSLF